MLTAAACSPTPELRNDAFLHDTSLVSGDPCEAPCWQNLTPGETIWGLAQDFFKDNDTFTKTGETRVGRDHPGQVDFTEKNSDLQCCRFMTRDGDVLTAILLLLAPDMKLGDVIARYGEPQYLSGNSITDQQATVALVFPDVPMVTYVFAENLKDSSLSEDSTIIGVMYLAPAEMELLLTTSDYAEGFYNWEGYGVLGKTFDGEFDITPQPQAEG